MALHLRRQVRVRTFAMQVDDFDVRQLRRPATQSLEERSRRGRRALDVDLLAGLDTGHCLIGADDPHAPNLCSPHTCARAERRILPGAAGSAIAARTSGRPRRAVTGGRCPLLHSRSRRVEDEAEPRSGANRLRRLRASTAGDNEVIDRPRRSPRARYCIRGAGESRTRRSRGAERAGHACERAPQVPTKLSPVRDPAH